MARQRTADDNGRSMRARNSLIGCLAMLVVLASAASAEAGVCDKRGYTVRWHGADGVFMHTSNDSHAFACSPKYGIHVGLGRLNAGVEASTFSLPVLQGRYAAWTTATIDDTNGEVNLSEIGRGDLSTGQRIENNPINDSHTSGKMRALAIGPNGEIGWVVDGFRKREVHVWDKNGTRVFARSSVVQPNYLAFALGYPRSELVFARVGPGGWPTPDSG
jgi:hypothetical protein